MPPTVDLQRGIPFEAPREVIETAAGKGFLFEADAFCDLVRGGWDAWTGTTPQESIDIAATLQALALSARNGAAQTFFV